jgi:hypothetical protein
MFLEKHTVSMFSAEHTVSAFRGKDDSMFLQNIGICLRVHAASQPRRIALTNFFVFVFVWEKVKAKFFELTCSQN